MTESDDIGVLIVDSWTCPELSMVMGTREAVTFPLNTFPEGARRCCEPRRLSKRRFPMTQDIATVNPTGISITVDYKPDALVDHRCGIKLTHSAKYPYHGRGEVRREHALCRGSDKENPRNGTTHMRKNMMLSRSKISRIFGPASPSTSACSFAVSLSVSPNLLFNFLRRICNRSS